MKLKNYKERIDAIPKSTRKLVRRSNEIQQRIHYLLAKNLDGSQKELAAKMGVTEPQISKILNGLQNFKLETLCKLEEALSGDIISTVCNVSHPRADSIYVYGNGFPNMSVNEAGELSDIKNISFNDL